MGRFLKFRRKPKGSLDWLEGVTPKKQTRVLPVAVAGLIAGAAIAGAAIYLPTSTSSLQTIRLRPSSQSVHFSLCYTGGGTNCVVDGDTFWTNGVNVRISDIDAPETHPPRCSYEAN